MVPSQTAMYEPATPFSTSSFNKHIFIGFIKHSKPYKEAALTTVALAQACMLVLVSALHIRVE
jgi:hypothetical protein